MNGNRKITKSLRKHYGCKNLTSSESEEHHDVISLNNLRAKEKKHQITGEYRQQAAWWWP